ncbi:MAG: transglycosylase domain-containing protein [Candidatus Shapirobacteria bacterium]|nr:transglycosylase domain-containing protein [Candidatus Shapirobacteria bacterium]
MTVKRTGTVFASKKQTKPLYWLVWFFTKIGTPFYWLFLGSTFILVYFSKFLAKKKFRLNFSFFHWHWSHLKRKIKWPFKLKKRPKKVKPQAIIRPKKVKFKKVKLNILRIIFPPKKTALILIIFLAILAFGYLLFTVFYQLPNPNQLVTRDQAVSTKIYDRNNQLLYKIYRNQNRTLVQLKDIPVYLVQATIAVEDAEFYHHRGFSWKSIFSAAIRNLEGDKLYGGSTITQQLVKNALLTPERTWRRKIKEIVLSLLVEAKFSKDEILQMYFNEVGYGGAAYGIEEAAQLYFNKSVNELTLAEAALLAGLPASPTSYSPFGIHPEKAKERQELVLRRMVQENFITEKQREEAAAENIRLAPQRTDIKAPHFVMYIKELLVQKYGERMVEEGGLEVKTSLDLNLQEETEKIVKNEVDQLQGLHITNGAALVTNPQTGEILAMVGSKDYFGAQAQKQGSAEQSEAGSYFDKSFPGNFNVTTALRQPGSSIKPVNYAVALQNGFTPATILSDTPVTYQVAGQPPYSPRNYDNRFHGNVPLRTALASSYNVPAVKVLAAFGVDRMIDLGEKMGITTWTDRSRFGLSLTLGGGEVKMVDMNVVYGTLANMGTRVDLQPILEIKNYKGEILEKIDNGIRQLAEKMENKKVLPSNVAYLLTDILSDSNARIPAFGPHSWLNIENHSHVAVKTGTTQNLRDNWAIGYTSDFVVSVWVGNNDNTSMSYVASGITGASPIWNRIMTFVLKDLPDKEFSQPENLIKVEVCSLTGTLSCEGCGGRWEYFLSGSEPKTHCNPEKIKEILQNSPTPTPTH